MRTYEAHFFLMFALAVFTLMIKGCANTAQIMVEQNDSGVTVVRLVDQEANVWQLKDNKHHIFVARHKGDIFKIKMDITRADGGTCQVNTEITAKPGQKHLLGSIGNEKICIKFPDGD